MLERPDAHLRILVNERDSLSLVEESELVHSVHIGYMNDLHRDSLSSTYRRIVSIVVLLHIGEILSNIRVEHDKLELQIVGLRVTSFPFAHFVRLPLAPVPLLHVHRVPQLVLHAVHHVVARHLRPAIARSEESVPKRTERWGGWAAGLPARAARASARCGSPRG